ncbi:helix-turn-helix transcriptional regulator [Streptomyces sp. STCH 565 A]|uniref:helix-turn-helix transcriptional regulator n=1 Tax=Streptomyces sp. STCH 565 A TaxID=2950532 RepID=UPI00207617B8|nr:helix-turn-helix transcriptional regulator [Streptomyces sp. STCH 565 A]MCM8551872.1 helix-turn-helix transcriptional regulator [Streptomyces sp. STCH 565 A]
MGLAERRRALGYSQEELAHALGVDRRTVGRWEGRTTTPQPPLRSRLAELLHLDLDELDALVGQPRAARPESAGPPPSDHHGSGDLDDMIRRQFLRAITVTSALVALPPDEGAALAEGALRGMSDDVLRMNGHLWQVYQLARAKRSVYPVVRDQLAALNETLDGRPEAEAQALCGAAGDLFQLAGELAFDGNRYTDAAASYTLAASASQEAKSYDLWACALVRHAYVDLYERRYADAIGTLSAAEKVARRGDGSLSTRHWVAAVQAEAYAGLGDLSACERALDEAEKVTGLSGPAHNGGWLRFGGSRLAEERGARYVQLGRLDLAEKALSTALSQHVLASGQSFRRRGAVLTDLAAIGARRQNRDQVLAYGGEALRLARTTSSGYVAHKLQGLRTDLGPLTRDARVAELGAEIDALCTT